MKILVLNASPKGKNSTTVHTALYLQALHPEHTFTFLPVGQRIKAYEKDFSPVRSALEQAELILFCYPVYAYLRYAREVVTGRNHEFRGTLTTIAEDSVREGVPCKTLYFHDEAADDEKLCYFDLSKYPREGFPTGQRFVVSVHGQSIVSMQSE